MNNINETSPLYTVALNQTQTQTQNQTYNDIEMQNDTTNSSSTEILINPQNDDETSLANNNDENPPVPKRKSCFSLSVMDPIGESLAMLIYIVAIVIIGMNIPVIDVKGIIIAIGGLLEHLRVRRLGEAASIAESIEAFREQNNVLRQNNNIYRVLNDKLSQSITSLEGENTKFREQNIQFEKSLGILGDNVDDIEKAKNELFALVNTYERENKRYIMNNLIHTFNELDRDHSMKLEKKELPHLKLQAKVIYDIDVDIDQMDSYDDDIVTFDEFINYIKKNV